MDNLSKPVTVHLLGVQLLIIFCVVPTFPFAITMGLYDLMFIPAFRTKMFKLFSVAHLTAAAPILSEGSTKDIASGIREELCDDDLRAQARAILLAKVDTNLDSMSFERIWSIFVEHDSAWLRPRCGKYTGPPAQILPIAPPYRGKRRRLSPAMKEELDKQLDSQLKAAVITRSKSSWASPCYFVMKKTGVWRVVIDYRELNKRIKADSYPLPLIQEILQESAGHRYYIRLDLNWGFWNLPLEESAKEQTAFITHKGLFQFNVIPFSMRNSPAEFQRCIDAIFGHLLHRNIKIYIDDIILFSDSFDELCELFEDVMKAIVAGGVFLNINKCDILSTEVQLLGHLVSREGYRCEPKRIQALREASLLLNRKELRSFFGAAGYLRPFIPNFSDRISVFRPLLKKNSQWCWTFDHDQAYHDLLQMFSDAVYLHGPRGTSPFVLVTDASAYSVGCALLQMQDDVLVPISFGSRGFSDTERKWDTREREAYAIKWGVQRNREMIRGHKIFVLTDHSSLKWAADASQSKIQRWMWYLAQFDISIYHLSGHLNPLADWLSRCNEFRPEDDEIISQIAVPIYAIQPEQPFLTFPTVSDLQKHNSEISELDRRQCYTGRDGLLYSAKTHKLYIPPAFRNYFVYWFHAGAYGGHRGINSTVRRLKQYIWWPKCYDDVKVFVKACLPCARNRRPVRSTSAIIFQRPSAFELVSVDVVGPRIIGVTSHYYFVIIDHCTRFAVTAPTTQPTTSIAVDMIRDKWFAVFSAPKVLLSDNQSIFTSSTFRTFVSQDLMAHLVFSSPYYPAGNAINESSHRALEHCIDA